MGEDNRALTAALRYARAGLRVLPLRRSSKVPLTPNGWHDSTTEPAVIREWWSEHPEYGIGVAIPDWCVIVDVDTNGLKSLQLYGFDLPDTVKTKTRRGFHYWYAVKGDKPQSFRNKIRHLPDVDLLVTGYVAVPPTVHSAGSEYQWVDGTEPSQKAVEYAPDWVVTSILSENAQHEGLPDEEFLSGIPVGQRQTHLFRRACRMRQLRNTKGETLAVLRDLAAKSGSADYDVGRLVERVWKTYDAAEEREDQEVKIWTLADLLEANLPPPSYLIEDLLPGVGYTLLYAPQKVGKSALAGQVALCVASGCRFMGRGVEQSGVLVLDIEQDDSAAGQRWGKMLRGNGMDRVPPSLHLAFSWPSVDRGGLEKLGEFLAQHSYVRLVILDTLSDFWPEKEGQQGNAYNREAAIMRKFDSLSKDYGVALLVVTHSRKPQGKDTFADRAVGTRAITGKAKALWSLEREFSESRGYLLVSGKNIPERKIEVTFDEEAMLWR